MKLARIIVNLPEKMIEDLNEQVKKQEDYISRSGLIRKIINEYLKRRS